MNKNVNFRRYPLLQNVFCIYYLSASQYTSIFSTTEKIYISLAIGDLSIFFPIIARSGKGEVTAGAETLLLLKLQKFNLFQLANSLLILFVFFFRAITCRIFRHNGIQEESFQASLNEPDSANFRAQAADIENVFEPYFRSRFPGFQQIVIDGFFNGSSGLRVRYRLSFHASSNASNTSISQALGAGNKTKNVAFYELGGELPVRKLLLLSLSTTPSTTLTPVTGKELSSFRY